MSLVSCHPPGPTMSAGSALPSPCCCSPGALLPAAAPAPALLSGEPWPCRGPGLAGMGPRGSQLSRLPALPFPSLVTASARSCMGSASLPKYSQGARVGEDGVSRRQPLHPPVSWGCGIGGTPTSPSSAACRGGHMPLPMTASPAAPAPASPGPRSLGCSSSPRRGSAAPGARSQGMSRSRGGHGR